MSDSIYNTIVSPEFEGGNPGLFPTIYPIGVGIQIE